MREPALMLPPACVYGWLPPPSPATPVTPLLGVFVSAAPLLGRLRLHRSIGSTPKARANERCALVDAPASRDEAIRLGERGAGSLALAGIQRTRCLTKELQQRNIPSILRPDAPDGVTDHRHDRCPTSREKREANLLTARKVSQHDCANGDRKEQ